MSLSLFPLVEEYVSLSPLLFNAVSQIYPSIKLLHFTDLHSDESLFILLLFKSQSESSLGFVKHFTLTSVLVQVKKKSQAKWTLSVNLPSEFYSAHSLLRVHQVCVHPHFFFFLVRGNVPSPVTRALSLRKQAIWALAFLQNCFHLHSAVGCYPLVHTHSHSHRHTLNH